MDRFINAVKSHSAAQAAALGQPRMGIVTSYNPNDGSAKVQLQPEGILTGWLPVLSNLVGSGWGLHANLDTGTQVCVIPQEGDATHGIIVGRAYSDQMRPPSVTGADITIRSSGGAIVNMMTDGQVTVTSGAGAIINMLTNGQVSITDPSGTVLTMTNNGSVVIQGTLFVTEDIIDQNGAHGSLSHFRSEYDTHEHGGVQSGSSNTGIPSNIV